MTPPWTAERWGRAAHLYYAALERSAAERQSFLVEACAGDETLLLDVRSLLDCHVDAKHFLSSPALEFVADTIVAEMQRSRIGSPAAPTQGNGDWP